MSPEIPVELRNESACKRLVLPVQKKNKKTKKKGEISKQKKKSATDLSQMDQEVQ